MKRTLIALIICLVALPSVCYSYSKSDSVYMLDTEGGDGYQTDFIAAHADASNGDTIQIPSGSFTWEQSITITKAIVVQGAGEGSTTIDCAAADQAEDSSDYVLKFNVDTGISWELSGITFIETHGSYFNYGGVLSFESSTPGRVHHCSFNGMNARVMQTEKGTDHQILFDNCTFREWGDLGSSSALRNYGNGVAAWQDDTSVLGGAAAVFIEDCIFFHSNVSTIVDVDNGGKFVFRYNSVTNAKLANHGLEDNSGMLFMEVYKNNFSLTASASNDEWIHWRGGTGIIWDNYVDQSNGYTYWAKVSTFNYCFCQRSDNCGELNGCNETEPEVETCAGGYPCKNQQGRGPNQILMPLYAWDNTTNTGSGEVDFDNGIIRIHASCDECDDGIGEDLSDLIVEGRDYYEDIAHPEWVPHTYPHPLRGLNSITPEPSNDQGGGACFLTISLMAQ